MTTDPALDLAVRQRLPDALRVLVEQYPRSGWEAHPEFNALTRFWLDRHLMFRRLQSLLLDETAGFLDRNRDPRRFGADLGRLGGAFLSELHGHHLIEDSHYFPILRAQDARLAAGFDLLDADHHALDGGLHALADATNGVLRGLDADARAIDPAARLKAELDRFALFLDRHLTDEEELVVPVILEYRGAGLA
jgi:iron-sulfur cluster repair protein YtfE (RIC family)